MSVTLEALISTIITFLATKTAHILLALVVFVIGYFIIKRSSRLMKNTLERLKVDASLHAFIIACVRISAIVLLAISCLDISGLVETTSLVTALGAVGLAISLAVKDSLSNLAGGMMMLFSKPFAVGDYIDTCGHEGSVSEVGVVYTTLNTIDNKRVYVPNGDIAKSLIVNYSAEKIRRLDIMFSIGYNDDFEKAKEIILSIVKRSKLSLNEPQPPFVRIGEHGSSAIGILSRTWVLSDDYWDLKFYLLEEVKKEFDLQGISIPFDQLDVHIVKDIPTI